MTDMFIHICFYDPAYTNDKFYCSDCDNNAIIQTDLALDVFF